MAYQDFLTGGEAALLILAIVVLEAIVLGFRHFKRDGASPMLVWLSPLLAGGALVLALFFSQRGGSAELIGTCLLVAGLAHAMGVRMRWGRQGRVDHRP